MLLNEILMSGDGHVFETKAGTVYISKERDIYNTIRTKYKEFANNAMNEYAKIYDGYSEGKDFLQKGFDDFLACVQPAVDEIKNDMVSMERYDLDDKLLFGFINKNNYFAPFFEVYEEVEGKMIAVNNDLEGNIEYRQARKDGRSRWQSVTYGGNIIDDYGNQARMGHAKHGRGCSTQYV